MCEICSENASKAKHFECPQTTDWPDHPWDKETRIREDHGFARFKRENPEQVEQLEEKLHPECSHEQHHMMIQGWQSVEILAKVCNTCGKTIKATEDF